MFQLHKSTFLVMLAAAAIGCGTGGKKAIDTSPGPEQVVRALFAAEWNANADSSWAMFHPAWKASGFHGDFAKYANNLEKKKQAWKDDPPSFVRIKAFSGAYIPGYAQAFVDKIGREQHEFAVVRAEVVYPPVQGYFGGTNDYLITLARKKETGASWTIINSVTNAEVTELFSW